MGIHGLMGLLNDEAPGSVKEQDIKAFTGRKVAIDASMAMYQFLVAVSSWCLGSRIHPTYLQICGFSISNNEYVEEPPFPSLAFVSF
jgi:hypothetical protein